MNNMTGDPNNQQNRPSVFGFDSYPSNPPSETIDWSRIPMQSAPLSYQPCINNINPNFNYHPPPIDKGNLQFCNRTTPHPAQFPFPHHRHPRPPTPTTSSAPFDLAFGNHGFGYNPNPISGHKRKTLSPDRVVDSQQIAPYKQRITEEKMAEHMSKLYICSESSSSKETDTERTKRLYMCEEMRKLQHDSILPQSILSKMQMPCTALVLWTPPGRLINPDESNNGNNNEESTRDRMENDLNDMDFDM